MISVITAFNDQQQMLNTQIAALEVALAAAIEAKRAAYTGSYNRLDLIQSLVPTHYICNGYIVYIVKNIRQNEQLPFTSNY